jgi:hypothetical protein
MRAMKTGYTARDAAESRARTALLAPRIPDVG